MKSYETGFVGYELPAEPSALQRMNILGIDVGSEGALATGGVQGAFIELEDLEIANIPLIAQILAKKGGLKPLVAVLENVHPMPKQGIVSTGKFMRTLGVIEGILAANGIPYQKIEPVAWKKEFGLIGKDKEAGRQVALKLFPGLADQLKRKKDHNRADALLIYEYWRRRVIAQLVSA